MGTTTRRKYQRFHVKISILVNAAETLNGSIDGLGLLLAKEPSPSSSLLVSISDEEHFLPIQTEIRHLTAFNSDRKLVGVRFGGNREQRSPSPNAARHSPND